MYPLRLDANQPTAVAEAAVFIRAGALVAFPTDTLYGVGADAFSFEAIGKLFLAKDRDAIKGIPILLADATNLHLVVDEVSELAQALITTYWPGPLTLILPKKAGLPANISGTDGVAVRVPDNEIARRLILEAGGALAVSSANRSGEAPARTAQEALAALGEDIAAVLDGGQVEYGQASTILDCTALPPKIIRHGPIGANALAFILTNRV
jgi:tRNA threonylcarbamoyl adenosine modification protein (Sua5/YciO/YrdC/YwlC family)